MASGGVAYHQESQKATKQWTTLGIRINDTTVVDLMQSRSALLSTLVQAGRNTLSVFRFTCKTRARARDEIFDLMRYEITVMGTSQNFEHL